MKTVSRLHSFFKALACLAQLAALFPFAVIFEALGLNKLVVWHFTAIYGVWIIFWLSGRLIGYSVEELKKRRIPKKLIPLLNFATKAGVAVPIAAFIFAGVWLDVHSAAYFYILPAAVISYFGGDFSVGKSYSDIFTKGWFALYVTSALVTMAFLALSKETDLSSEAGYILCVGFGIVILLSAVLANQTNIDFRTKQRDAGKAVLPSGLRRYNAALVIVIFTLTLGLFIFAKPIAGFLKLAVSAVISGVMAFYLFMASLFDISDDDFSGGEAPIEPIVRDPSEGISIGDILSVLLLIAAIVCVIVFRKQIFAAIKSFFAPLFKRRKREADTPFADEITSSDIKRNSPRLQKKAERELLRQYVRETSPERKFRLGYAVFLTSLRHSANPPAPSDTTDVHRQKGEAAFGEELREFSETYNRLRYGDIPPTPEEIAAESELITRIRKNG